MSRAKEEDEENDDVRFTGGAADLHESYCEFLVKDYPKDSVRETRKSCSRYWLEWCQENGVDVRNPETADLRKYIDSIRDLADTSIGARVTTVSMLYLYACGRNLAENNPAEGFSLNEEYNSINPNMSKQAVILAAESQDGKPKLAISREAVEQIRNHAGCLRNSLIIGLLHQTGIRCGELAGMKLEDVDFDEREIWVTTAKAEPGDPNYRRRVYYQETLDVPMYQWVKGGHREQELPNRMESDYLLVTDQSKKMRPSHISRIVKNAAKRAGINEVLYTDAAGKKRWKITGHTLRHTFCSHALNDCEIPPHIVKELMGHRKLETTMQYWTRNQDTIKEWAQERGPGQPRS